MFKLCTKFERNRIIHGCVIDDLARFRCAILRGGALLPSRSKGAWTRLHQTWRRHSAITSHLFHSSDSLLHFQTWAAQS